MICFHLKMSTKKLGELNSSIGTWEVDFAFVITSGILTKIEKIHVRFSFSNESSKLDQLVAQITSLNSSGARRTINLKFIIVKDQNNENPRKIFIFSKNIFHCAVAPQIWAHNSSWALRTMHLKFATFCNKNFLAFARFLVPFFLNLHYDFGDISRNFNRS